MENVFLVFAGEAPVPQTMADVWRSLGAVQESADEIYVRAGDWSASVWLLDLAREEDFSDDWEATMIPPHPIVFAISDYSVPLVKRLVLLLAQRYAFWVDLGHRRVYTSEAFRERCRREPSWNWARDPPPRSH